MSRPPEQPEPRRRRTTLLSLPSELHLLIALHLYSPLHLTQQDRLTWSVFSTVDMDPERWHGMDGLIAFAGTCKAVRRTVRYLLFRCVRIHGLKGGRWLIRAATTANRDDAAQREAGGREKRPAAVGDDWGKYVHSVILDMAMFDPDQQQAPPDEIGRRSEEREYDPEVESRRAIRSRVANWTTSVQTYLSDLSNGEVSPLSRPGEIPPLDADTPRVLVGGMVTDTPGDAAPGPVDLIGPLGNDVVTESPGGDLVNATSGVDNSVLWTAPLTVLKAEKHLLSGKHNATEGVEEEEEDDEEDWVSFPLTPPRVRDPWKEASFLITMLTRLPNLHHLSIFADPSDDLTLSLLFSNPAMLAIAPRLRSFGWRLRASPPSALREFDNSTMYVSVQGWLKECTSLGFLVLDSDIETEGVREVDLERVVKCLGEGRERTVRRRLKEARKEAKLARQDPATYQALSGGPTGGVKRKLMEGDEQLKDDAAKRQKADYGDMDAINGLRHQPLTKDRLDLRNHKHASQHDQHRSIALTASRPASSSLSLMLCGPIQGWILSPEAEMWAAENMDDLRTWMSETKSALRMVKTASDDDELSPCGHSQARKADYSDCAKADEATAVSERIANGPLLAPTGADRIHAPTTSMLSPVSVLSSSYSPVIQMSGVAGGNSYFAHHPNHTIHQEMQGMQPYIYHISNAPYQPQFSGIVPSYAQPTSRDGPAPNLSSMAYPIRPPVRSHSRSFSPLSDAERRKAALDDRPPVFLDGIVREFTGIKELFIDRPIRAPYGSEEETLMLLTIAMIPLIHLPDLTLLQIGGYPLSGPNQLIATELVVLLCPKILLCGWLGLEGETNWYGVWRDRKRKVQVQDYWGRGEVERFAYRLKPLGDGDMFELEEEQQAVAV